MSGYPCARSVRVEFADDSFVDGIEGLNPGHAMWRARCNWDGAVVTDLGPFDPAEHPFESVN